MCDMKKNPSGENTGVCLREEERETERERERAIGGEEEDVGKKREDV